MDVTKNREKGTAPAREAERGTMRQGGAKLPRTLRLGTPHAEARRLEAKLPGPMCFLVFDLVDANGILEHHAVGTLEIQEPRTRGGVAARAEDDGHALA